MSVFKIKIEKDDEIYINRMKDTGYDYFLFFDNDTLYFSLGRPLLFKSYETAEICALEEYEKTKRNIRIGKVFFVNNGNLYPKEIYPVKPRRSISLQEFIFKQPDDKMWVAILPDGSIEVDKNGFPIFHTKEELLESSAVAIAKLSHYLAENKPVIVEFIKLEQ